MHVKSAKQTGKLSAKIHKQETLNGPFFLKAALWVDSHGEIGSEYLSAAVRSI